MGMFTFLSFDPKYHFWAYLVQKLKFVCSREKFATLTNSNVQNSMAVFFGSVLGWKYPFWESLVQIMKIVGFS